MKRIADYLFGAREERGALLHGEVFFVDKIDSLGLLSGQEFEPEETRLISEITREGDVCLDIGANIGYYTTLLAKIAGNGGKVFAFEPDHDNFMVLSKNIEKRKIRNIVSAHKVALSDIHEKSYLYKCTDNHGMHRLYPSICCTEEREEVNVVSGDSLQIPAVDIIKIDIEGYEYKAISGLRDTISRSGNIKILSEYSPLSMREAGFSVEQFVSLMDSLRLLPLELKDEKLKLLDISHLYDSSRIADRIDIINMKDDLGSKDNNEIAELARLKLNEAGYTRPLLENILWVKEKESIRHLIT